MAVAFCFHISTLHRFKLPVNTYLYLFLTIILVYEVKIAMFKRALCSVEPRMYARIFTRIIDAPVRPCCTIPRETLRFSWALFAGFGA